ncbi:MAG TPA: endonuclease/exonuclease/phosphatase family protein [Anaerolineae bacterium]
MSTSLRIATFNVENLFSRAKVLNFADNTEGDTIIVDVGKLQKELSQASYDKPKILKLYKSLKDYITIAEVRNKLFNRQKTKVVADGAAGWSGFISFKRDKFSEPARLNTAKVIREINADIFCLVEVESRPVLKYFVGDRLKKTGSFETYPHLMLIDGNDDRGIDVAMMSRLPIQTIHSHVDDKDGDGLVFSRDCLELQLRHPDGFDVFMLLNHFKSKGFGAQSTSDNKRRRQAERVAKILEGYDLTQQLVVVAGDLNDTPDSAPLAALKQVPNLFDVLAQKFQDPKDRWTYHFNKNQQIDYLFVSRPLRDALQDAGVERRGIFNVKNYTNGAIDSFKTVTSESSSASDHGAVWADFTL